MTEEKNSTLALFYCQNTPGSGEKDRQSLEERYGKCLRLFPIPCSGRLDHRAKKRVERTRSIIGSIGLEGERVGIVVGSKDHIKSLTEIAQEIVERINQLGPSPVLHRVS
jgi:coenzyme F420-reducing hydrogenase delta subunit